MTSIQIDFILEELNTQFSEEGTLYGPELWLEAREIGSIILSSDESIYPDETLQVKFDSPNELLFVRKGKYVDDSFTETLVTAVYEYKIILGINLVRNTTRKSPYKIGRSI